MDNCSAHAEELKTRGGSVTCMFLPPNTTLLIQPMDQGVVQAVKNGYKRKLLQKVICGQHLDLTQNIKELVKQHTVKDVLYMLADVWEEGSTDSIQLYLRHTVSCKFIPVYGQMFLRKNWRSIAPNL